MMHEGWRIPIPPNELRILHRRRRPRRAGAGHAVECASDLRFLRLAEGVVEALIHHLAQQQRGSSGERGNASGRPRAEPAAVGGGPARPGRSAAPNTPERPPGPAGACRKRRGAVAEAHTCRVENSSAFILPLDMAG